MVIYNILEVVGIVLFEKLFLRYSCVKFSFFRTIYLTMPANRNIRFYIIGRFLFHISIKQFNRKIEKMVKEYIANFILFHQPKIIEIFILEK